MQERMSSNNTNKLSPQERVFTRHIYIIVQIIQINLALKNCSLYPFSACRVQIIQINLALKNELLESTSNRTFK